MSNPIPEPLPVNFFTEFLGVLKQRLEMNPNGCKCAACNPNYAGMIVCGECGNKRCPHATHHNELCTVNNAPGQPGSAFGGLEPTVAQVRLTDEYLAKFGEPKATPEPVKLIDGRTLKLSGTGCVKISSTVGFRLVDAMDAAIYETLAAHERRDEEQRREIARLREAIAKVEESTNCEYGVFNFALRPALTQEAQEGK